MLFATKNIATKRVLVCCTALFVTQLAAAALPVQSWKLANGAQVWLVESPTIPMVDLQIDFDAGGRRDPVDKAGLASVTAGQAGKGIAAREGEPAMDENAVSEAWTDLGASFGGGAGNDRMSFSMRSLTYPDLLAKAVKLAARELAYPAFPRDVWARDRQRMAASIRESNTRPATVAYRAYAAAVYGTHPYGFETTEQSLARIEVEDMKALYARVIVPCRAKVSIVGAVTRAQAEALVDELFARLPRGGDCATFAAIDDVAALGALKEQSIPFESAQAHVLIGQPGFRRADPDYFALIVGNYILGGGGFVSRLYNEVREKRGLSYSVYSGFAPGLHAGAFTIGLQTRPDQAQQAVDVSRQVLARFIAEGPTDAELKAAKDNLVGGFALRIDSNAKLLDNIASMAWNGLPLDYLDTWTQQVEKVTVAEIKAAFARKLQADRMVTVVVGARPPRS